jgi:DNA (cytosine-5)-methyltransferase 1
MTPMVTNADLETTKTKDFIEQMRGHQEMRYRIRKLTPRECFRLMGVDDKDIDTIQGAGISNSQMYKMAGNSIVVDTLYHLFRKMFCETENEQQQMTLF